MASLLDRISAPGAAVGPVRNRGGRAGTASPYNRTQRPPKGDINGAWKHDLFDGGEKTLSARLGNTQTAPKINLTSAQRALADAQGEELSIKGASLRGNVVEVSGLAEGTTAADVEAIFKGCGPVTNTKPLKRNPPVIRVTYKNDKDALAAVHKFHGQPADGRILSVKIVGNVNSTLSGRLSVPVGDSVDVLMEDTPSSTGSKLRSDEILAQDTRARVMVAPPGTNPSEYTQRPQRGRGRGRGRGGRRGGGGGAAARMDVD